MDKHGVTTDLVVKADNNTGIGYDIDGYRVDKNGVRYIYLFLSSKADMGAVNVTFSDGSTDTLDLTSPIDCNFDSGKYRIVAMQSDLPTLYLNIDESKGTIDAMNSDPNHDTKCKAEMLLDVPDKLVEQNGWESSYVSSDVTVKGRGNTTWGLPKKPYQIKLDSKQDILGMGKNKTWVLLANYCVNHCVYCGYNCKNNIKRAKLSFEEIEAEYRTIAQTGLKEILILTGESRAQSDLAYIGRACELAQNYFSTIGIEIYPVDAEEYAYLHSKGADFVSVYQETYNTQRYDEVHLSGPKKDFSYRFNAQERALLGGMRGVGFGALLGLSDFRRDAFAAGLHAKLIQARYPHAEISFSVPRLRPFKNQGESSPLDVHETQLLQVMLAYRLLLPFAGMTISSRERAGFRDNVAGMAATKLSASVKTSVGGHDQEEKGDAQFEIADGRSLRQVEAELTRRGMQPVYTDYIRV